MRVNSTPCENDVAIRPITPSTSFLSCAEVGVEMYVKLDAKLEEILLSAPLKRWGT
jgi:hypothetical protein